MASLNKVMLIGNLGRDVELAYVGSGKPVAKFTMAVSRNWKTPEGEMGIRRRGFFIHHASY